MLTLPYFGDALTLFKKKFVGDGVDQLIGFGTTMIYAISALIVVGKQLIGSPMSCFIPSEFRGENPRFILDYCYGKSTYVVPRHEAGVSFNRAKYDTINYYQWISAYFVLRAVVVHFPTYLWRKIYRNNDIDLTNIIKETKALRKWEGIEEEKGPLKRAAISMLKTAKEHSNDSPRGFLTGIMYGGCSYLLTTLYLRMKLVNLMILIVMIYETAGYLDNNNFFWSYQAIQSLLARSQWVESTNFPRTTMCDVPLRTMGNLRNLTVQCLLGMNYVNEKLFFVQWIWLLFVILLAIVNVTHFIYNIYLPSNRAWKLQMWLNRPLLLEVDVGDIIAFADVIGLDGYTVLYFVEQHNGSRRLLFPLPI